MCELCKTKTKSKKDPRLSRIVKTCLKSEKFQQICHGKENVEMKEISKDKPVYSIEETQDIYGSKWSCMENIDKTINEAFIFHKMFHRDIDENALLLIDSIMPKSSSQRKSFLNMPIDISPYLTNIRTEPTISELPAVAETDLLSVPPYSSNRSDISGKLNKSNYALSEVEPGVCSAESELPQQNLPELCTSHELTYTLPKSHTVESFASGKLSESKHISLREEPYVYPTEISPHQTDTQESYSPSASSTEPSSINSGTNITDSKCATQSESCTPCILHYGFSTPCKDSCLVYTEAESKITQGDPFFPCVPINPLNMPCTLDTTAFCSCALQQLSKQVSYAPIAPSKSTIKPYVTTSENKIIPKWTVQDEPCTPCLEDYSLPAPCGECSEDASKIWTTQGEPCLPCVSYPLPMPCTAESLASCEISDSKRLSFHTEETCVYSEECLPAQQSYIQNKPPIISSRFKKDSPKWTVQGEPCLPCVLDYILPAPCVPCSKTDSQKLTTQGEPCLPCVLMYPLPMPCTAENLASRKISESKSVTLKQESYVFPVETPTSQCFPIQSYYVPSAPSESTTKPYIMNPKHSIEVPKWTTQGEPCLPCVLDYSLPAPCKVRSETETQKLTTQGEPCLPCVLTYPLPIPCTAENLARTQLSESKHTHVVREEPYVAGPSTSRPFPLQNQCTSCELTYILNKSSTAASLSSGMISESKHVSLKEEPYVYPEQPLPLSVRQPYTSNISNIEPSVNSSRHELDVPKLTARGESSTPCTLSYILSTPCRMLSEAESQNFATCGEPYVPCLLKYPLPLPCPKKSLASCKLIELKTSLTKEPLVRSAQSSLPQEFEEPESCIKSDLIHTLPKSFTATNNTPKTTIPTSQRFPIQKSYYTPTTPSESTTKPYIINSKHNIGVLNSTIKGEPCTQCVFDYTIPEPCKARSETQSQKIIIQGEPCVPCVLTYPLPVPYEIMDTKCASSKKEESCEHPVETLSLPQRSKQIEASKPCNLADILPKPFTAECLASDEQSTRLLANNESEHLKNINVNERKFCRASCVIKNESLKSVQKETSEENNEYCSIAIKSRNKEVVSNGSLTLCDGCRAKKFLIKTEHSPQRVTGCIDTLHKPLQAEYRSNDASLQEQLCSSRAEPSQSQQLSLEEQFTPCEVTHTLPKPFTIESSASCKHSVYEYPLAPKETKCPSEPSGPLKWTSKGEPSASCDYSLPIPCSSQFSSSLQPPKWTMLGEPCMPCALSHPLPEPCVLPSSSNKPLEMNFPTTTKQSDCCKPCILKLPSNFPKWTILGDPCISELPIQKSTSKILSESESSHFIPYPSGSQPCVSNLSNVQPFTESTTYLTSEESSSDNIQKIIIVHITKTYNEDGSIKEEKIITEKVQIQKKLHELVSNNASKEMNCCDSCNASGTYDSDRGYDTDKWVNSYRGGDTERWTNRNLKENKNMLENTRHSGDNKGRTYHNYGPRQTKSEYISRCKQMGHPKLRSCISVSGPKELRDIGTSTKNMQTKPSRSTLSQKSVDTNPNKSLNTLINTSLQSYTCHKIILKSRGKSLICDNQNPSHVSGLDQSINTVQKEGIDKCTSCKILYIPKYELTKSLESKQKIKKADCECSSEIEISENSVSDQFEPSNFLNATSQPILDRNTNSITEEEDEHNSYKESNFTKNEVKTQSSEASYGSMTPYNPLGNNVKNETSRASLDTLCKISAESLKCDLFIKSSLSGDVICANLACKQFLLNQRTNFMQTEEKNKCIKYTTTGNENKEQSINLQNKVTDLCKSRTSSCVLNKCSQCSQCNSGSYNIFPKPFIEESKFEHTTSIEESCVSSDKFSPSLQFPVQKTPRDLTYTLPKLFTDSSRKIELQECSSSVTKFDLSQLLNSASNVTLTKFYACQPIILKTQSKEVVFCGSLTMCNEPQRQKELEENKEYKEYDCGSIYMPPITLIAAPSTSVGHIRRICLSAHGESEQSRKKIADESKYCRPPCVTIMYSQCDCSSIYTLPKSDTAEFPTSGGQNRCGYLSSFSKSVQTIKIVADDCKSFEASKKVFKGSQTENVVNIKSRKEQFIACNNSKLGNRAERQDILKHKEPSVCQCGPGSVCTLLKQSKEKHKSKYTPSKDDPCLAQPLPQQIPKQELQNSASKISEHSSKFYQIIKLSQEEDVVCTNLNSYTLSDKYANINPKKAIHDYKSDKSQILKSLGNFSNKIYARIPLTEVTVYYETGQKKIQKFKKDSNEDCSCNHSCNNNMTTDKNEMSKPLLNPKFWKKSKIKCKCDATNTVSKLEASSSQQTQNSQNSSGNVLEENSKRPEKSSCSQCNNSNPCNEHSHVNEHEFDRGSNLVPGKRINECHCNKYNKTEKPKLHDGDIIEKPSDDIYKCHPIVVRSSLTEDTICSHSNTKSVSKKEPTAPSAECISCKIPCIDHNKIPEQATNVPNEIQIKTQQNNAPNAIQIKTPQNNASNDLNKMLNSKSSGKTSECHPITIKSSRSEDVVCSKSCKKNAISGCSSCEISCAAQNNISEPVNMDSSNRTQIPDPLYSTRNLNNTLDNSSKSAAVTCKCHPITIKTSYNEDIVCSNSCDKHSMPGKGLGECNSCPVSCVIQNEISKPSTNIPKEIEIHNKYNCLKKCHKKSDKSAKHVCKCHPIIIKSARTEETICSNFCNGTSINDKNISECEFCKESSVPQNKISESSKNATNVTDVSKQLESAPNKAPEESFDYGEMIIESSCKEILVRIPKKGLEKSTSCKQSICTDTNELSKLLMNAANKISKECQCQSIAVKSQNGEFVVCNSDHKDDGDPRISACKVCQTGIDSSGANQGIVKQNKSTSTMTSPKNSHVKNAGTDSFVTPTSSISNQVSESKLCGCSMPTSKINSNCSACTPAKLTPTVKAPVCQRRAPSTPKICSNCSLPVLDSKITSINQKHQSLPPRICSKCSMPITSADKKSVPRVCFKCSMPISTSTTELNFKPKTNSVSCACSSNSNINKSNTKKTSKFKEASTSTTGLNKIEYLRLSVKKSCSQISCPSNDSVTSKTKPNLSKSKNICTIKIIAKQSKASDINAESIVGEEKISDCKTVTAPRTKSADSSISTHNHICKRCSKHGGSKVDAKQQTHSRCEPYQPKASQEDGTKSKCCDVVAKESTGSVSCKSMGAGSTCSYFSSKTCQSQTSGSSQTDKSMSIGTTDYSHFSIKLTISTPSQKSKQSHKILEKKITKVSSDHEVNYGHSPKSDRISKPTKSCSEIDQKPCDCQNSGISLQDASTITKPSARFDVRSIAQFPKTKSKHQVCSSKKKMTCSCFSVMSMKETSKAKSPSTKSHKENCQFFRNNC